MQIQDFNSVAAAFPDAEMVGGRLILYSEGKHIELGLSKAGEGTFTLTPAGIALMQQRTAQVDDAAVTSAELKAQQAAAEAKALDEALAAAQQADAMAQQVAAAAAIAATAAKSKAKAAAAFDPTSIDDLTK